MSFGSRDKWGAEFKSGALLVYDIERVTFNFKVFIRNKNIFIKYRKRPVYSQREGSIV